MESRMAKKILVLFLISGLMYLTSNSANAYLVHVLGHETYGDYSISILLIFALTPLLSLGTLRSITKQLPILLKKNPDQANIYLKWNISLLIKSFLIILCVLAIFFLIDSTDHSPRCIIETCIEDRHLFFDVLFIAPVTLLAIWLNRLLNATQHPISAKIFNTPSLVYFTASITFIFTLINNTFDHTELIMVIFIAFFLLTLIQSIIVFFTLCDSPISYRAIMKARLEKNQRSDFLKNSLGMMLNSIGYIVLSLECLLLLEWIEPNEANIGYYVIVTKIGALSGLVGLSMSYLFNPMYSGIKDSNKLAELETLFKYNALLGLLWFMISTTLFFTLKPLIFRYYSINFPYAEISIISLFLFNYLASGLRKYETICLYNNLNRPLLFITIAQIIISATACLILIPRFSYVGAIMSIIISETISFILSWALLRERQIYVKVFGVI